MGASLLGDDVMCEVPGTSDVSYTGRRSQGGIVLTDSSFGNKQCRDVVVAGYRDIHVPAAGHNGRQDVSGVCGGGTQHEHSA